MINASRRFFGMRSPANPELFARNSSLPPLCLCIDSEEAVPTLRRRDSRRLCQTSSGEEMSTWRTKRL